MDISFTYLVIAHQLVNGIEDATIQEKVIACLLQIQKYIKALELGKWNQSALQESSTRHIKLDSIQGNGVACGPVAANSQGQVKKLNMQGVCWN